MQRAILLLSFAFTAAAGMASAGAGSAGLLVDAPEPARLELMEVRTPEDLLGIIEHVASVDDAFVAERILRSYEGKFLARDFRIARRALDERKLALGIGGERFP